MFFNADIITSVINKSKGAIAFINDYTTWVTGPDMKSTTQRLQAEVIPKLEIWAEGSGAIFNPEKIVLIHFTRNRKKINTKK